MSSFNKVFLMGNLTRDPEVRYTPKGSAVTDLGLAVNRVYTLDSGERREDVTFVDVTVWGRQAEIAGQYLSKGRPIFIEGRLQLDSWEDKTTGEKRNKLRVVCENMKFIGGRPEGGGQGGPPSDGGDGGYQKPPMQTSQGPPTAAAVPAAQAPAPAPAPEQAPAPDPGPMASDLDEEDDIPF